MSIDIICPIYNAEKYILDLHSSLLKQKNVNINKIIYILTKSIDNTENLLRKNNIPYELISKKDFSHSLVREKAALESDADIICFITQDVVIKDEYWLEKLIMPIINDTAVATYSRQLTKYNNIEKYTREYNYPNVSLVKSYNDINTYGLNTFFFSDASSAVKTEIFKHVNGYDHKNLPINEDMYLAYKLIMQGYKIKYCANSVVYHSHNFKLKEIYNRYKLIGIFFKENKYLNNYKTNNAGFGLAKYVLKRIIEERKLLLLIRYPFDMGSRYIGMKVGNR